MEANELRIGSLIDAGNNCNVIVRAILYDGEISTDGGTGHISEYEPITLTEKWLSMFGFETDLITYDKNDLCLGHFKDDVFLYLPSKSLNKQGVQIKYVHTLQNIYFALTGKELIILN